MSIIGGTSLSLMDVARRTDGDGKIAKIVEILSEQNSILEDMMFEQCNNGMVHRTTVRTGLPAGMWRRLYGGVQSEKSTTEQIQDACGMLETYSKVDKALADMSPDKGAFLLSESVAFLEGLSQTMADTLIYGNEKNDKAKFTGLAARYGTLSTDERKIGFNVISGGGSGTDNTSIYVLNWGSQTMHGLYPKGSKAGVTIDDRGQQTVQDKDGNDFEAYVTHYKWDMGFCLRDWRYGVRIANIDVSDLASAGESGYSGANLINLLIKAFGKFPKADMGRRVIYCNRTVMTALNLMVANHETAALKIDEVGGKPVTKFWGVPIRQVDAIRNDEAAVA